MNVHVMMEYVGNHIMKTLRFSRLSFIATCLLLGGCITSPLTPAFPDLTFVHLSPIFLDVARIEIVEAYTPPLKKPNVEHEFSITPSEAVRRWSDHRLISAGVNNVARIIIRNASVVEIPLERKEGLVGLFTVDQVARYDGTLDVSIEIRSDLGAQRSFVRAYAKQSRSIGEEITLNARQVLFYEITEGLIGNLDVELEKGIRAHMAPYLL